MQGVNHAPLMAIPDVSATDEISPTRLTQLKDKKFIETFDFLLFTVLLWHTSSIILNKQTNTQTSI